MIEYLFPTPVYVETVGNLNKIQFEIGNAVENCSFSGINEWGKTHQISDTWLDYQDKFEGCVIEKYNLTNFKDELDIHLKKYCSEIGIDLDKGYEIKSWFVKYERGSFAHVHSHNYADIAGVYYFNTNKKDGKIFFETPVPGAEFTKWCHNKLMYRWGHDPKKGKLLLFPGWLRHGVMTNETDNIRIAMSFNIFLKT